MKKFIITLTLLFMSTITFAQEEVQKNSLEQTLQPYVEKLLSGIEQGVEIASKEIPEVLMQYVIFNAVKHSLWVVIAIVIIFISIKYQNKWMKFDDWETPISILGGLISLVGVVIFFTHIFNVIKAIFFPKLFLIEEFIKLI